MGFFDIFKKEKSTIVSAPTSGEIVEMADIADEVFSGGTLGFCCGIEPDEGKIYAPCEGVVTQLSETMHAVGLQADDGAEILIHVGIDTVEMQGEGFASSVSSGDRVQAGQLLLTMDREKIREAGHPATVVTIITNSDEYREIKLKAMGKIVRGRALIEVIR